MPKRPPKERLGTGGVPLVVGVCRGVKILQQVGRGNLSMRKIRAIVRALREKLK